MSNEQNSNACCDPSTGCCPPKKTVAAEPIQGIVRRDFIKMLGLTTSGVIVGANAIGSNNYIGVKYNIPTNKGLSTNWYKSLYERGNAEVYTGKELAYIGMPIGGLCSGTVYLGGDGKLWLWDIFNENKEGIIDKTYNDWGGRKTTKPRDGANYIFPVSPEYPFEQGFGIKVVQGKKVWEKSLDFKGFNNISFKGQYPMAEISYSDAQLPVAISLQSFSPFIPLDVASSSYPATVMTYKVKNTSNKKLSVELAGWLQNAVLNKTKEANDVVLTNTIEQHNGNTVLACKANTASQTVKDSSDFGSMSLLLISKNEKTKGEAAILANGNPLFPQKTTQQASAALHEQLIGTLSKTIHLEANETKDITFIISWYFPNVKLPQNAKTKGENKGRHYSTRFNDAKQVAVTIAENYTHLYSKTQAWKNVFYEASTLPHWFLNRAFLNTSILATETSFLLKDGRFWAWEGIGCCSGSCTHVWHYAQALGRIFPSLEKNLREKTDFLVIDKTTGGIDFRGGLANKYAADGQAGIALRSYRDYQLSTDKTFLEKNWDAIKLSLQYLINLDKEDGEANGTIFGEQHNTLDAEWYGNIPVITSLYLAALAAAIAMAKAMNDIKAEQVYTNILETGKTNIEKLFNGEYFIQQEDPKHKKAIGIGKGCYIDQVFGQGWAHQVGLGQLYNKEMIDSSLDALWKYNFVPDMGKLRNSLPPTISGRPYALSGEAGLVMCTWPLGGKMDDWEKHWQFGYFNECMTGFEHQVSSHMIWENKLDEGLSIMRAVHERYSAAKRNPYNEIECSDHYSRAMASYGAFIAACGFTYHGPNGELGFAPKINPENFKAAFTAAEGWGSLQQTRTKGNQTNTVELIHGKLALQQLTVELSEGVTAESITLSLNKKLISVTTKIRNSKVIIVFNKLELKENDTLTANLNYI